MEEAFGPEPAGHLEDLAPSPPATGVEAELVRLVTAWAQRHGTGAQFCGTLRGVAGDLNLHHLLGTGDKCGQAIHLCQVLEQHAGQVIGEWQIVAVASSVAIRFALSPPGPGVGPKPLDSDMEPTT